MRKRYCESCRYLMIGPRRRGLIVKGPATASACMRYPPMEPNGRLTHIQKPRHQWCGEHAYQGERTTPWERDERTGFREVPDER